MLFSNRKIIFLLIISMSLVINGCDEYYHQHCLDGKGVTIEEERDVDGFTAVHNTIPGDIHINQGEVFEVRVSARENVIHEIETFVSGDELVIDYHHCINNGHVEVFITMPQINEIVNSGSGRIHGENIWEGEEIEIRLSGSGSIDTELYYEDVSCHISGSGRIETIGECNNQELRISGSGNIDNFNFLSLDADVNITGSGHCEIYVEDNLNVNITGSGTVFYRGNPDINSNITGSGRLVNDN